MNLKRVATVKKSITMLYHYISAVKHLHERRCPISLEQVNYANAAVTVCGHAFQKAALTEWVNQKGTCPSCRTEIKKPKVREHIPYVRASIPPIRTQHFENLAESNLLRQALIQVLVEIVKPTRSRLKRERYLKNSTQSCCTLS